MVASPICVAIVFQEQMLNLNRLIPHAWSKSAIIVFLERMTTLSVSMGFLAEVAGANLKSDIS